MSMQEIYNSLNSQAERTDKYAHLYAEEPYANPLAMDGLTHMRDFYKSAMEALNGAGPAMDKIAEAQAAYKTAVTDFAEARAQVKKDYIEAGGDPKNLAHVGEDQ